MKRDFENKLSEDLVRAVMDNMEVFGIRGNLNVNQMIASAVYIMHSVNLQYISMILEKSDVEGALEITKTIREKMMKSLDNLDEGIRERSK